MSGGHRRGFGAGAGNNSGRIDKDTVADRVSRGRGPFSIDIMQGAESYNSPDLIGTSSDTMEIDGKVGESWIAVNGQNCILGPVALQ